MTSQFLYRRRELIRHRQRTPATAMSCDPGSGRCAGALWRYGCFMAGSPAITVSCVGARLNGSQICVRPSRSVAATL